MYIYVDNSVCRKPIKADGPLFGWHFPSAATLTVTDRTVELLFWDTKMRHTDT